MQRDNCNDSEKKSRVLERNKVPDNEYVKDRAIKEKRRISWPNSKA